MMLSKTKIARHGAVRSSPPRPLLMVVAVYLAFSAVANASGPGDHLAIRSGCAELWSASPREIGRIPVVFIHGMLGSPANWSAMIDRLSADPPIRARYQFLTFRYDSLQSIPESGRELLEALVEARRRFDPEGLDNSFDRVVLVGHSLGGLVAKSAAIGLGPPSAGAGSPPPEADRRPPRPRVARLVFVATPHRGAPVDRGMVRSAGTWIARGISPSIVARHAAGEEVAVRLPTSVDQLTWDHPLLQELERSEDASGVTSHSIIATLREPTEAGATDGIVPVASARHRGARSEVVIRASHVCFQNSEVIREVRRVLGEHAAEPSSSERPGTRRPSPADAPGPQFAPPLAGGVTLRRPVAPPDFKLPADASLPIPPVVVPECGTP